MEGLLLAGRYRMIEEIGCGGMARVWRGYDEILGRPVAIKLATSGVEGDLPGRLRNEARIGASLTHAHILAVHDYGESPSGPFLIMDLAEGETLDSVLIGQSKIPWKQAVSVCAQIAAALAAVHQRGIVHRDISAANVILTRDGAKILDFGIAAFIGDREPDLPGDLLGTHAYVAPERLRQAAVAPAADVYSVGILLYRCLRGGMPWVTEDKDDLLTAHLWLSPAPLPPVSGMPSRVAEICYQCLAKDPADRPTSASLAASLAELGGIPYVPLVPVSVAAASPTVVLPKQTLHSPMPLPRSHRKAYVTGAAAVSAAAAVMLFAFHQPARPAISEPLSKVDCHVSYQVSRDTGTEFDALITVQSGRDGVGELRFGFPDDQQMTSFSAGAATQSGREVTIEPNGKEPLRLSGRYAVGNSFPADFSLNGQTCKATLSFAPQVIPVSVPSPQAASVNLGNHDDGKDKGNGKAKHHN